MVEFLSLKNKLIIQSFLPLFILTIIKYSKIKLYTKILFFFNELSNKSFDKLFDVFTLSEYLILFLLSFCAIMSCIGMVSYVSFKKNQQDGYREETVHIVIDKDITANSVAFFMTYIIPLLLNNVIELSELICFFAILSFLFFLMSNTDLYYQNPFLTVLGYKTYQYYFDKFPKNKYIGITRGNIDTKKLIKQKKISDNIYIIFNKN